MQGSKSRTDQVGQRSGDGAQRRGDLQPMRAEPVGEGEQEGAECDPHAPKKLADEIAADYADMNCAAND
jgi:hypothetical protein